MMPPESLAPFTLAEALLGYLQLHRDAQGGNDEGVQLADLVAPDWLDGWTHSLDNLTDLVDTHVVSPDVEHPDPNVAHVRLDSTVDNTAEVLTMQRLPDLPTLDGLDHWRLCSIGTEPMPTWLL